MIRLRSTFITAVFFLLSISATAERLKFPVEKNNVQIFPQRFEYALIDENHIRIGDIMIDANKVSLELIPQDKQLTVFRFRFRFPSPLMTAGELVVKDSIGKAIWIQKFEKANLAITPDEENERYRVQMAFYDSVPFEKDFLTKLENTSFFRFCVSKIENETKINLCSKELFLKYVKAKPTIQSRDPHRKDSYVVINGRPVDPSGIVFLNEVTDPISLQALLLSGASVEIDTRRKQIRYTDILQGESKDQLIIRAQGTTPVDESKVKRISADEWEMVVPARRPTIYLNGEGGIPMRQEFLIKGSLRSEAMQVEVIEGATTQTYSPEVQIKLKKPTEVTLSPGDKRSSVDGTTQSWMLNQLEKGKINKRGLFVIENNNKFYTEYEVYRGHSILGFTRLMYPLFSQTQFQWWHGGFNWGVALNVDKSLSKSALENDWSKFSLEVLYRFQKGMNLKDPTFGLLFFADQASYDAKATLMGMGLFADLKVKDPNIDWVSARLHWPLSASGDNNLKLKSGWNFEATARKFKNDSVFYELGFRAFSYKFENTAANLTFNRNMIFLGIGSLL